MKSRRKQRHLRSKERKPKVRKPIVEKITLRRIFTYYIWIFGLPLFDLAGLFYLFSLRSFSGLGSLFIILQPLLLITMLDLIMTEILLIRKNRRTANEKTTITEIKEDSLTENKKAFDNLALIGLLLSIVLAIIAEPFIKSLGYTAKTYDGPRGRDITVYYNIEILREEEREKTDQIIKSREAAYNKIDNTIS
ncbi:hypothetical protein [Marinomonas sp.]|uniref:hypothetical protein n=1 Tax=Marinomonas sp. TaxID=1904862 RepID=UPI003BAA7DB9